MVLIFFEDELENTETNIVVIAKKKSFFTRVGGCSAENRRAFLWPRQWGMCLLSSTQFVPFISFPAHAESTYSQWGTLQIDRFEKRNSIHRESMKGRKGDGYEKQSREWRMRLFTFLRWYIFLTVANKTQIPILSKTDAFSNWGKYNKTKLILTIIPVI